MNKRSFFNGLLTGVLLLALVGYTGSILPIARGGTGSSTKNFVDLTTAQSIAGAKEITTSLKIGATGIPMTRIWTTTASIDPPSQAEDSSNRYAFAVSGVTTADTLISWSSTTADVGNAFPVSAHVSGTDEVSLVFHSRVTINIPAYTYTFTFIRS